ncbi:protein tramtrack, beta isoform-like isoform X2 [Artemia franciscana]|uniref:protein tramtrack, beta isoform-like isoform X2 n=2 Tax=Artemia franciscana TaxID=6661 RepID=UPI0032DB0B67
MLFQNRPILIAFVCVADLVCTILFAMEQKEFCLKWNNYTDVYKGNFATLLNREHFTDVTLSCDNQSIKCHRLVLSACSSYFENVLINNSHSHPIIILKDVKFCDIQALVKFIYTGEVTVAQAQFNSLLSLADMLKVTGLADPGESSDKTTNTAYPVERTEVSKPSPTLKRRRVDLDSEHSVLTHDSLQDSVPSIPLAASGTLLNNKSETRPSSSLVQQKDSHLVESEVVSNHGEEPTGTIGQFVNSLQYYGEEAGSSSLFSDSATNFNYPSQVKDECVDSATEDVARPEEDFGDYDYTNESGTAFGVPDHEEGFMTSTLNESDNETNRGQWKAKYKNSMIVAALKEIQKGHSFTEVALKFSMPRTSLHNYAKKFGIVSLHKKRRISVKSS